MASDQLYRQHTRLFANNRFVYPVLSRRAGGISLGVNLNPDKVCNFDCIYCQVDRSTQSETQFVAMEQLAEELEAALSLVVEGGLFEQENFSHTPAPLRRLNDIAFSGDGEPTTYRNFDDIIRMCAEIKRRRRLPDVKMVLITNAGMLHRPHVQRGLRLLDENQGEIWAKIDAGTPQYFAYVDRTKIPFEQVLDNITAAARQRPLVIQSLFMRIENIPPNDDELQAYCRRLQDIIEAGGRIKLVQIYTVARRPAESFVTPLSDREVDHWVARVRRKTGLPTQGYYGGLS